MTATLARIGRFGAFSVAVLRRVVAPPWFVSEFLRHTWLTTTRCLGPVVAVTFPFGMVMALQGLAVFALFGAQRLTSSLISIAVLRELSPVMASVLVAAQGGSSCAAELGAMRIKEEIDATEVMGVDGLRYHVAPRLMAMTVSCPLLNVAGSVAGLCGGYVTAVLLKGEPSGVFLHDLWTFTTVSDVWAGIFKTTIFGTVIGLIACYHGYNTSGGAAGVGRAVNDTVVQSVLAFITLDYFLTSALFGGMPR